MVLVAALPSASNVSLCSSERLGADNGRIAMHHFVHHGIGLLQRFLAAVTLLI